MFITEEKVLHWICKKGEYNHYLGKDENVTEKRILSRLEKESLIIKRSSDGIQEWYCPTNQAKLKDLEYKINYRRAGNMTACHYEKKLKDLLHIFYQNGELDSYKKCNELLKKIENMKAVS